MKYTLLFLFVFPLSAGAEIFAANGYLLELQRVELSKKPRSLELLYSKGQELCDELAESLDSMDARELSRSTAALRGIDIWTSEPSGAALNVEFFLSLAVKKGKKADRDFFSILKDERTAGGGDVYTALFNDFAGCVTLGSGVFVKFYERWGAFQEKYPKNYPDAAQEARQNIEDVLRRATCVCGTRGKALKELNTFMHTFPGTPVMDDLAERSVQFRKNASGIRFECKAL